MHTSEKATCPKCLYQTGHAFNIAFKENICLGCLTHEEKNILDWDERNNILVDLVKPYKSNGQKYDCIVPVSGDAEDYFVISNVLDLGMSPLIVSVNDYFKNDIGWKNYHNLITYFDLDSITFNPDLANYKELIKTSFRKESHVHLPWLYLHTAYPVHVAIEYGIQLIIWGQCQPLEQVGKYSYLDQVEMTKWSRLEHDILGIDVHQLIGTGAQLNPNHLKYYNYPEISQLSRKGIKGIYLSNFLRWDPLTQNKATLKYGFTPQMNTQSYDPFERAGSSTYYAIHDLLKFSRVGYRKLNDHIARDLRHHHIDIPEARNLMQSYGSQKINVKDFFNWLDVSESGYEWIVQHHLSSVKDLIVDHNIVDELPLPSYVSEITSYIASPTQTFIPFGKGI